MESERIGQSRKEYAVTNTVMSNLRMKKDAISYQVRKYSKVIKKL